MQRARKRFADSSAFLDDMAVATIGAHNCRVALPYSMHRHGFSIGRVAANSWVTVLSTNEPILDVDALRHASRVEEVIRTPAKISVVDHLADRV